MNATANLSDVWADASQDRDFLFQAKAQDTAVALSRAVSEAGMTRAELAQALGWKPSRISHVLSGAGNLTLRTIFDLTSALGLEFDLQLRKPGQTSQPRHREAQAVLDDAHRIHKAAQHNLTRTEALLDTALHVNRRTWQLAGRMAAQQRHTQAVALSNVSNGN